MTRRRLQLFGLLVVLSGCAGAQARSEARGVAIAFAKALRRSDTTAMKALAASDHVRLITMGIPSDGNARLEFREDRPDVEFRGSTDAQYNFLIRTESDTLDPKMAGIWVVVTRTDPPRVRSYTLFPDIWPKP